MRRSVLTARTVLTGSVPNSVSVTLALVSGVVLSAATLPCRFFHGQVGHRGNFQLRRRAVGVKCIRQSRRQARQYHGRQQGRCHQDSRRMPSKNFVSVHIHPSLWD
mgnify:CR=1 FL=1